MTTNADDEIVAVRLPQSGWDLLLQQLSDTTKKEKSSLMRFSLRLLERDIRWQVEGTDDIGEKNVPPQEPR